MTTIANALNINFSANQLVYSTSTTTLAGLTSAANGVLITNSSQVPSISQTLPSAVQGNITTVGTVGTGAWQANVINPTYGGTGVNNGSSTITIGGNLAFSGPHTFSGTLTGNTAVTFPTSGTLATVNGTISSIIGTTNVIDATTVGTVTTINIDAAYVGQTSLTTLGTVTTGVWNGTTVATGYGGTGVTSVTTAPTASSFAGWDANSNLSANSFIGGYATTATAGTTTTLTVSSAQSQYFTGSANQTVKLPVANTLVLGQKFTIVNLSSGTVTVESSGGNSIQAMAAASQLIVTCILASGTGTSSWSAQYVSNSGGGVTSVSGDGTTTSVNASTGAVTVSIINTYAGQTSITTLGTIATGVWGGTTVAVAHGGTGITSFGTGVATALGQNVTGSGGIVLATSPTLVTPVLGTPSSGTLTSCSGLPISGIASLGTGVGTALAANVTGSGGIVLATSPTLVTPVLGTPSSGTLTSCSGLPISGIASLGTGVGTALAATVTGSGGIVLANTPTLITPVLGAATGTSVSLSSGILGTTAGGNASSGYVGEIISSVISSGSAVAINSSTAKDMTTISLTAGDWDVYGNISFVGSTNNISLAILWASLTSGTLPDASLYNLTYPNITFLNQYGSNVPYLRVSISMTTTVYITGYVVFATGTVSMQGGIYARRVR